MTDPRVKVRKVRLPKLTRIEKLTRGLLSTRDVNAIFTVKEIKGKGRGVFLRSTVLRKDSFVLEYEGDIISEAEAQIRERIYSNNNEGCYIMSFSFQGAKLAVDATRKFDSIARLLNHSREPNIRFHPPFVIDLKGGLPRIASYALRDIYKGEEIVIDYGVRDGHITWLRNREIGFVADVDSNSSDDSDGASSDDSHTSFQTSERPSLPEHSAPSSSDAAVSERPIPAASQTLVSEPQQIRRGPDIMAFSRGEWGVRLTRLVPGGGLNSYFAGFENIETPQKILKCLEVSSERNSQKSVTESVVCLSSSSSGSSRMSVRTSCSSRKNTLSKHSSENVNGALSIELPSNKAPDSIHKVLEWQKKSPLPDSALNIQIVGVQSLSDFLYVERDTNSELSSSNRQQSDSAFQTQGNPPSSLPHPPADANLLTDNQNSQPAGAFSSYVSSPTLGNNVSVVTVDTSESDDTCESSSLSSLSVTFITPRKKYAETESAGERKDSVEADDVFIVSDDECVPGTPVSELEQQNAVEVSIDDQNEVEVSIDHQNALEVSIEHQNALEVSIDDQNALEVSIEQQNAAEISIEQQNAVEVSIEEIFSDDSSSECEIILAESPNPPLATAGHLRNLPAKRAIGFSSPPAQLQVAVIEPYENHNGRKREESSRETVFMTSSEIQQLKHIFDRHIGSNNASKIEVSQAINTNWDVFSVLLQRGVTLTQIRNTFNSFFKLKR